MRDKKRKWFNSNDEAGVITVEACLALPVFLCFFFLLLYLTRIACLMINLDHAASQTAKHIAASSYPLSFVNEFIDDNMEDFSVINICKTEAKIYTEVIAKDLKKNSLPWVIWGFFKDDIAKAFFETLKSQVPEDSYGSLDEAIKARFLQEYEELTNTGKNDLAGHLLKEQLNFSQIEPELLTIKVVELPKSEFEFDLRRNDPHYQETGLIPGQDFTKDDVVIQLEYNLKIPIPFFQDKAVKLRSTAIERAWTNGSNGVYTKSKEGLDFLNKDKNHYVYKARTGSKYHIYPDCAYLQKSCITITLEEAKEMKLTKHANCPNRF